MILIDDRGHIPPLLPYFKPYAIETEPVTMDASDIFFCGNGPTGTCTVGIERKRLADLTGSIRSTRLVGFQLDGLLEYDYPILLVEGIWRAGKSGELEILVGKEFRTHYVGRQVILYREVSNFLMTMNLVCGLTVIRTSSPEETAAFATGLYSWFAKEWDEHKAHMGIYAPVPDHPSINGHSHKLGLTRRPKPTLVTKMAAQVPGLDMRAWKVGEYFAGQPPLAMCCPICATLHTQEHTEPSEKVWQEIEGIGKKGAKKIVEVLQNG